MARPWRAFLLIFFVHLGVQGFSLTKVPTEHVRAHTRWEVPAVAMALYERGEFADPYCLPTGPTAHMPPRRGVRPLADRVLRGHVRDAALKLLSAVGAWRSWPRLSVPQRAALVIPLVTFPLVYYVVGFEGRYRQPMDGLALLLAAAAFVARKPSPGPTSGM